MTHTLHSSVVPQLSLRQDARRIPEHYSSDAPDTFEWWYFDAQLADGRALVIAFVIDPDPASGRFVYRTQATLTRPDGPPLVGNHRTYDDVAISTERPEVRIGQAWLRGDLDTYRVVVDAANHNGLGMDLTIERTVPSRVSPSGSDLLVDQGGQFGWVNAVPRGDLFGTLTINGQATDVRGVAYHDHNWGTTTMGSMVHHWIWGRAAIGPYTAVFADMVLTRPYQVDGVDTQQSLYIASGDEVLVNVIGAGAARVTATTAPNPSPRNHAAYYASSVVFEIEQPSRQLTLEVAPASFLHDIDLANEANRLNTDERARAATVSVKPWYTEFQAAPVRLTVTDLQDGGHAKTSVGGGIIEFMDFHLNPR
jgi:predicted secreted hydrolase